MGPSHFVLYLSSLGPFAFPASCPCGIHFFPGLHTSVSTCLAESSEDVSCPIASPSICVTLRNMVSSNSRTPTVQSLLHCPLAVDDQPWMGPTVPGLKGPYTAYPRGSKNRTKKGLGVLQAPIKAPQGWRSLSLSMCHSTQHEWALSTYWLKEFLLKHLFR